MASRPRCFRPHRARITCPYLTKEAEDGDQLVVAVGFDFIDALGQVAKEFPKTKFAIIDTPASAIAGKPKNVEGLTFLSQQSGYLVGYLSGSDLEGQGLHHHLERRRSGHPVGD